MAVAAEAVYRSTSRRRHAARSATVRDGRKLVKALRTRKRQGLSPSWRRSARACGGEWPRAQRLAEQADKILTERCKGAEWERPASTSKVVLSSALHLGEWSTLADVAVRLPKLIQEATTPATPTRFMSCRRPSPFIALASDQLALGMDLIEACRRRGRSPSGRGDGRRRPAVLMYAQENNERESARHREPDQFTRHRLAL